MTIVKSLVSLASAAAIALMLTACAGNTPVAESTPSEQPLVTDYPPKTVVFWQDLGDESVLCVSVMGASGGGLSCDWAAKTSTHH